VATFGKTTDGTSASGSSSTATKVAVSRGIPDQTGQITTASAQMSFAGATNVRFAIYAEVSSAPGATPLALSDIVSLSDSTMSWRTFTFSGANLITVTAGTPYWIGPAWEAGPGATYQRDSNSSTDITTQRREGTGWTWPNPTSPTWAPGQVGPVAAYVTYSTNTVYSKTGGGAGVGAGSGAKTVAHATTYAKTGGAAGAGAGSGAKSLAHSYPKTGGAAGIGAGSGAKVLGKTNPKTGGAAAIGAGTGHRTPASALPASAYNLTRWHITLPSDTDSNGVADQIDQPALATYFDPAYFILDSTGRMVFTAPVNGATTSGASGATRSELREHEAGSYSNSAWDPNTTGRRQLTVTLRADATSITGGTTPRQEMIIFQIHGASGTPPLYLAAEWTSSGSPVTPRIRLYLSGTGMTNANVVTADATTTDITIRVRVVNAVVTLWAVAGQVADLPSTPTGQWAASAFTDQVDWYFKHGAYNKTAIDSGSSGQAVTKTSFFELLQPGDVNAYAKTGGAAGIGAGSGAKTVSSATTYSKTGGAAAVGAGSGARAVVHDKTGGGAAAGAGSGARSIDHSKTGGAAAPGAGSGARSVVHPKTGGAASPGAGSGAKSVLHIAFYDKTGGAAAPGAGSGARSRVLGRTGGAAAAGAGSGAKTLASATAYSKTGGAAASGAGSGDKTLDSASSTHKTGGAVATGAGSGAVEVGHPTVHDKTGGGAAIGTGSGARALVHTKTGGAAAVAAGSGAAVVAPATVHPLTGGAVATGAGSGALNILTATVHAKTGGGAARGAGTGARATSSATVYTKTGGGAALGAGIALVEVIHATTYAKTGGAVAVGAGSGRRRIGGHFHAGPPRLVGTLHAGAPVAVGQLSAGEPYAVGQLHAGPTTTS
jgi:ribonucleotide reductase alpha subunit